MFFDGSGIAVLKLQIMIKNTGRRFPVNMLFLLHRHRFFQTSQEINVYIYPIYFKISQKGSSDVVCSSQSIS